MSFELFLGIFRNGRRATAKREVVEKHFASFTERREPGCWVLDFPDGGGADLYISEEDELDGFMVSRPVGSELLWRSLFDVMRQMRAVIYWAGDPAIAVVAEAAVENDLPSDMIESIGRPIIIAGPIELARLLR